MKKVSTFMNLTMGVTLSFCMSLIGNLTSEKGFTIVGFLVSFVASFLISLFIGFNIRIGMIEGMICGMAGAKRGSMKARFLETVISDVVYTPLMTFCMVLLAWFMSGKAFPFGPVFFRSFLISLAAAFIIIFIVKPLYFNAAVKKYDVDIDKE